MSDLINKPVDALETLQQWASHPRSRNSDWNSDGLRRALRRVCYVVPLTSQRLKFSREMSQFPILPTGRMICSTWNKIEGDSPGLANQTGNIQTVPCWTKLTDSYPAISPTRLG